MEYFYKQVEFIEGEVKMFVDELFQFFRLVDGVFDMLFNFKYIRLRKVINDQMM